jgi:anti-sigma factor RsiW
MNQADDTTCEQLSAWMDGELSAEEARFLERRLQNDPALRDKWERMQLASSCLRGQVVLPMPALAGRVAAALETAPPQARTARRPLLGWAIAASVAALAIAFVPRMTGTPETPTVAVAPPAAPIEAPVLPPLSPTPGSADLVADLPEVVAPAAIAAAAPTAAAAPATSSVVLSPTEFPLADGTQPKSWPRPGLPGSDDAAMEGYLVRHNEMAGADALGGFVPYLDVVAAGQSDAVAAPAAPEADAAAKDDQR